LEKVKQLGANYKKNELFIKKSVYSLKNKRIRSIYKRPLQKNSLEHLR